MSSSSFSPEEREARRQRALVQVANGQIGGPRPGSGRPRKKRAAEVIAEEAQKNASAIVQVLKDGIDKEQPTSIRLAAAREWVAIENKEADLQLREERELEKMDPDELAQKIATSLTRLVSAGAIDAPTYETVDAD